MRPSVEFAILPIYFSIFRGECQANVSKAYGRDFSSPPKNELNDAFDSGEV